MSFRTNEVILSTRVRLMRNLQGFRFPHEMEPEELVEVMTKCLYTATSIDSSLETIKGITIAERDTLLARRLISPGFKWQEPGRALLLNPNQDLSLMVNEEDHLRFQMITPSDQLESAHVRLRKIILAFDRVMPFSYSRKWGYLASSVYNSGSGVRFSALVHLLGLQLTKNLTPVLSTALDAGMVIRGAFGEGTRPVGAFLQVSTTTKSLAEFGTILDYLVKKELESRQLLGDTIEARRIQMIELIKTEPTISFEVAMRLLSVARLVTEQKDRVDACIDTVGVGTLMSEQEAGEVRREQLSKLLPLLTR